MQLEVVYMLYYNIYLVFDLKISILLNGCIHLLLKRIFGLWNVHNIIMRSHKNVIIVILFQKITYGTL